ncbi:MULTISPECIES: tRNA (adenine(22)-N(1))-methyltransferase [Bacillaceae]|uniref:tRNA (adenine(22)-N(1))-methyltransferase n=1 Tax=Bacillaceae TaxID=186817 RepID=UPI00101CB570|nr:tRNA (adenine(22)-N(1))-methyltransferase TrmK [Ectobacillus funiculus]
MNEVKLSKRLQAVAEEIIPQSVLADIGSDHAYLPCYCVLHNRIVSAIAGEVVEGPYQSAKTTVEQLHLEDKISVRKGDGLSVLAGGEADVITICGMGGALIRDILERGKGKLQGVQRLVLQPNIGAHNIRQWLIENGWELKKEQILKEDGKIYEILCAEKGNPMQPYEEQETAGVLMGPFLLPEKNTVFVEKWQHELKSLKMIYEQLNKAAETEETERKRQELLEKIALIEEALG